MTPGTHSSVLSNRQVIYTSFIMKNLSYYSDTKLFDGESILVKHIDIFISDGTCSGL